MKTCCGCGKQIKTLNESYFELAGTTKVLCSPCGLKAEPTWGRKP